MVRILCNALFKGGVYRDKKTAPFKLALCPQTIIPEVPKRLCITHAGVQFAAGQRPFMVREVTERGIVLLNDREINLWQINLRFSSDNYTVLVTDQERAALADHFGLPLEIIDRAYFVNVDGLPNSRKMSVNLMWDALLDPKWEQAFLLWLAGGDKLPKTKSVIVDDVPEQWQTLSDKEWKRAFKEMQRGHETFKGMPWKPYSRSHMSFPGLRPVCQYRNNVRDPLRHDEGRMAFREEAGSRYAWFIGARGLTNAFILEHDRVDNRGEVDTKEKYDKEFLKGLLVQAVVGASYDFNIKAGKLGEVNLGAISNLQVVARASKTDGIEFISGKMYFFTITRINADEIEITCYLDKKRTRVYCRTKDGIAAGQLRSYNLLLRKP